jgi:hypothetical protein
MQMAVAGMEDLYRGDGIDNVWRFRRRLSVEQAARGEARRGERNETFQMAEKQVFESRQVLVAL